MFAFHLAKFHFRPSLSSQRAHTNLPAVGTARSQSYVRRRWRLSFVGRWGGGVLPLRPPRSNRKRNDDVDEFVRLERKMNPPNAQRTLR